jgi:hypothetical protein
VLGKRFPDVSETIRREHFDRLGDAPMQVPSAPGRELGVGNLADPLVREAQALADRGEKPSADQLLHTLCRRLLAQLAGVAEKVEVELAADRGRRRQE